MGIDQHFSSGSLEYQTMMPAAAWVFALYNHFGSHPPVPSHMSATLPYYLFTILTVDHSIHLILSLLEHTILVNRIILSTVGSQLWFP